MQPCYRKKSVDLLRWIKLAGVLTFWALSFILNEIALRDLSALVVVAGRWLITAGLVLGLLARRGELARLGAALRADWWPMVLLSLVGVTLLYGLQVTGQVHTTAVNAGLLSNMVPIFTALLAGAFLDRRIRPSGWAGMLMALGGAWIVSTGGLQLQLRAESLGGDLLVVLSAVSAALYFVVGARLLGRYSPLLVTAAAATLGAVTLSALALLAGDGLVLTWPALGAMLALGVGPGLLSNLWWWETAEWLDPSRAALSIYLIPLLTMGFAVVLLQETVSLAQAVGALLVLAGVGLAERGVVDGR